MILEKHHKNRQVHSDFTQSKRSLASHFGHFPPAK